LGGFNCYFHNVFESAKVRPAKEWFDAVERIILFCCINMTYFLFAIYLVFFCWLVTRIRFFQNSGLNNQWLIGLFVIKIMAGLAYGLFFEQMPNHLASADTWRFFHESKTETKLLLTDPARYFGSFIDNPHDKKYGHLFSPVNSYWKDLKELYMVKLVSVFNLFSGSRYYVNVIFYAFITFFGPVAFMRIMNDVFPGKKYIIAVGSFLIPSFLFWTSGVHKDGFVFMLLALAAYLFYFGWKENKLNWKRYLLIFLLILIIFPVRNHVVLAAIPSFAAWWLAEKFFTQKWLAFLIVSLLGISLFFAGKYIHPKFDLPISIVLRQKDFNKLGGNSVLPQRELKATFPSFVKNAPQALNHTLARPYLTEIDSPFYLLSALELAALWLIIFIWFFRFNDNPYKHSVVLFFLMLSIALLLLTGYIVPQLGAIVRYRSIFLPLIMVPILATSIWEFNTFKKKSSD
jgi:hypothetical protein